MKKTIWTGTITSVIACAAAAALSAQAPASPPSPPAPGASQAAQADTQSDDKKVVVTGCLKAAPSSAETAGTAGATGAAGATGTAGAAAGTPAPATGAADQQFMLTDAAPADPAAAANTPDATAAGTARMSYRLVANPAALSPHVGKKLELTGTLENPNSASQDATSGPDADLPKLRVASGKIVAASCDEK